MVQLRRQPNGLGERLRRALARVVPTDQTADPPSAAAPRRVTRWDASIRPTLPRGVEAVLSVALLGILAALDYKAGPAVDLAVFYFIPIAIAAWSHGLRFGLAVAAAAVASSHLTTGEV